MVKRLFLWSLFLLLSSLASAQTSTNHKIEQGTFNNGGSPSPELTSANYKMTLDSIGEGITATGMASADNKIDSGLPAANIPPGEVETLLLTSVTEMAWSPEPSIGSYNIYRGDVAGLPGSYGTKVQSGLTNTTGTDSQMPNPGQCLIYLVTASNRLGEEGPKTH